MRRSTVASRSASRRAAPIMSRLCEGTLTGRVTARFAPRDFATSMARATALACPAITTCPGALKFTGLHDLPLLRLAAGRYDLGVVEPEDGGHCARPERHGLLHDLTAEPHEVHRVPEIDCARADQRGVFTEAVPGHGRRTRVRRAAATRASVATPAASMAGCVRSVLPRSASGPCWQSAQRS